MNADPESNTLGELEDILVAHRALAVLTLLRSCLGVANDMVIRSYLAKVGLEGSYEDRRQCLEHLGRHGLVETRPFSHLIVVTLTERGEDAARGALAIGGVERPGPGHRYPGIE
ncbi:MAG TPA: hypothetical protein VNT30_12485 [Stellaceae bacterium]|nr:hypothetical protein [Stellaceae bacterium]